MEAHLHGVSTRKVDDLVRALGADSGISKSEVSRICADFDEVAVFRDRRYLSEGSMALLNRPGNPADEVAQPSLTAAQSTLQHLRTAASYTTGGTSPALSSVALGRHPQLRRLCTTDRRSASSTQAARPPHSQIASRLPSAATSLRPVSRCEKALTSRRFQLCGERVNVAGERGEGSLRL
jgi:hypothetical protein